MNDKINSTSTSLLIISGAGGRRPALFFAKKIEEQLVQTLVSSESRIQWRNLEEQRGHDPLFFTKKEFIYNIIEQHENNEIALTYDKYTYPTKNADVASQVCSMHFCPPNLKANAKQNVKWRHCS